MANQYRETLHIWSFESFLISFLTLETREVIAGWVRHQCFLDLDEIKFC